MPCDSMGDQELVSRALKLRRQLQQLDESHEDTQQRLTVPVSMEEDGQLEMTRDESNLRRHREDLWQQYRHFSDEVTRRGLHETLVRAVQADDSQRRQE